MYYEDIIKLVKGDLFLIVSLKSFIKNPDRYDM